MNFKKFPHYYQTDAKDCGPTCLQIISEYYGNYFNLDEIRSQCPITKEGVSIFDICKGAEVLGFKTMPIKASYEKLHDEIPLPSIIHWRKKHFIVVYKVSKNKVYVSDPAIGLITYSKDEFIDGWTAHIREKEQWDKGVLIAIEPSEKFILNKPQKGRNLTDGLFGYLYGIGSHNIKQIIKLFIIIFILTIFQALFPIMTQLIVDYGISKKNLNYLPLLLIIYAVLIISNIIGNWIKLYFNIKISHSIKTSIISNFIIKLLKLPIRFFEAKTTGDILQRVRDYERIEKFITYTIGSFFFAIISFISFSMILVLYSPNLFLIFFFGSFIYLGWNILFLNIKKKKNIHHSALINLNQSHWAEILSNIQDIKNNNYGQNKIHYWRKVQLKINQITTNFSKVNQIELSGSNVINTLIVGTLTFYTVILYINNEITLGMLIAVQYIIGQLKQPIHEIINFVNSYQSIKTSYSRIQDVNRIKNEESDEMESNSFFPSSKRITLNNITFKYYENGDVILNNISINIPEGKTTAIVGSSGSGKSTLIKILVRLYKPLSGEMLIGSSNSIDVSLKEWRDRIGVVNQKNTLFKNTVLNNITLGKFGYDKDKLAEAIRIANLSDYMEKLPNGYNTLMNESGGNLSDGQKQKLFIARAIYKNPDFLFLDEATNALDAYNEKLILNNLYNQNKERTIVIVAHRLDTIKSAHQILVLKEGKVEETGNHESLINKKGEYYRLFQSQAMG